MLGVCSDFSRDIENMSFPESHMLLPVCDLVKPASVIQSFFFNQPFKYTATFQQACVKEVNAEQSCESFPDSKIHSVRFHRELLDFKLFKNLKLVAYDALFASGPWYTNGHV